MRTSKKAKTAIAERDGARSRGMAATGLRHLPKLRFIRGPYINERPGMTPTLTERGAKLVRLMASEGYIMGSCAEAIGVSERTFKSMMGSADFDLPARLAWEGGKAALISEMFRWNILGARKGGLVQPLFALKVAGFRDTGPSVEINNTTIDNRKIVGVPRALLEHARANGLLDENGCLDGAQIQPEILSQEAYLKKIGQVDSGDQRSAAAKKLHAEMTTLPPPSSGMVDVTPEPLLTLSTPTTGSDNDAE